MTRMGIVCKLMFCRDETINVQTIPIRAVFLKKGPRMGISCKLILLAGSRSQRTDSSQLGCWAQGWAGRLDGFGE